MDKFKLIRIQKGQVHLQQAINRSILNIERITRITRTHTIKGTSSLQVFKFSSRYFLVFTKTSIFKSV